LSFLMLPSADMLVRTLSKYMWWHVICWPNWTILHVYMSSTNVIRIPFKSIHIKNIQNTAHKQSYHIVLILLHALIHLNIQQKQKLIHFKTLHPQDYQPDREQSFNLLLNVYKVFIGLCWRHTQCLVNMNQSIRINHPTWACKRH
jgi:hypothetical protein